MLNVFDSEGVRYTEPKVKIMGIETSRSSTPQVVRDSLKKMIKIVMNGDEKEIQSAVKEFKTKFESMPPEDIAFPRGVSNVKKYMDSTQIYAKGTPIAVKGALIYNYYIKKLKLQRKYKTITDGDKIKFIYLKTPNPMAGSYGKDHVVSFPSGIPSEFNLTPYIDYDKQLKTSFLDPLSTILKAVGWEYEKKSTLESFFG
tara:strand:- start:572 stop:1171 length:600 start_codon:yes stop_codon:yes gene_type:complete